MFYASFDVSCQGHFFKTLLNTMGNFLLLLLRFQTFISIVIIYVSGFFSFHQIRLNWAAYFWFLSSRGIFRVSVWFRKNCCQMTTEKFLCRVEISQLFLVSSLALKKCSLNFKKTFWCLQFFQKTNKKNEKIWPNSIWYVPQFKLFSFAFWKNWGYIPKSPFEIN